MKKEDLTAKGLTEDQAAAVIAIYTEELKGFIPKSRFDEVNTVKSDLEKQVTDRDKQLADLKKTAGDNEELKKQIEKLENENKQEKAAYDARILKMEKTAAVKDALSGAIHPELLMGQIDYEKIVKNADGTFSGITDQVDAQKKAFPDLFTKKLTGRNPAGNRGGSADGGSDHEGRAEELKKLINDPATKLADRIAAKNELFRLESEE